MSELLTRIAEHRTRAVAIRAELIAMNQRREIGPIAIEVDCLIHGLISDLDGARVLIEALGGEVDRLKQGLDISARRWQTNDQKKAIRKTEITRLTAEVKWLKAELAKHLADVADAAGELAIEVPAPGTLVAKLCIANRILKHTKQDLLTRAVDAENEVERLTAEVERLTAKAKVMTCAFCLQHTIIDENAQMNMTSHMLECREHPLHRVFLEYRRLHSVLSSYITENTHPKCLPTHRFMVIAPDGTPYYFSTRAAAEEALCLTSEEGSSES